MKSRLKRNRRASLQPWRAHTLQAGRNHPAVIESQNIASAKQAGQFMEMPVFQASVGMHDQKPRRVSRLNRPQGDRLWRKLEIEGFGAHSKVPIRGKPLRAKPRNFYKRLSQKGFLRPSLKRWVIVSLWNASQTGIHNRGTSRIYGRHDQHIAQCILGPAPAQQCPCGLLAVGARSGGVGRPLLDPGITPLPSRRIRAEPLDHERQGRQHNPCADRHFRLSLAFFLSWCAI